MAQKTPKGKQIDAAQVAAANNRVKATSQDQLMQAIARAQTAVAKGLADVASTVTAQRGEIETNDIVIVAQKEELDSLRQIKVEADTLDRLRQEVADAVDVKKATHDHWEAERAAYVANRDRARSDEETWYIHKMDQEHQKREAEFEQRLIDAQRFNSLKQQDLERGWKQKEEAIKAAEQELAELRLMKLNLPEMIRKATEKDVAIACNSLKKDHNQEIALLRRDQESAQKIAASEKASLTDTVLRLESRCIEFEKALALEKETTKTIATEALKASSGRETAAALAQVANKDNSGNRPQR